MFYRKYLILLYIYFKCNSIDEIYIIKRHLSALFFRIGFISHSALLLHTKNNKYYICEYGSEKIDRNKVYLYTVDIKNASRNFINANITWHTVRKCNLNSELNIFDVYLTMKKIMKSHKYNLITWNCHIAQYKTRKKLKIS